MRVAIVVFVCEREVRETLGTSRDEENGRTCGGTTAAAAVVMMRNLLGVTTWVLGMSVGCGSADNRANAGGANATSNADAGATLVAPGNGPSSGGPTGAPTQCVAASAVVGPPKVDIIFVIDNSGSMDDDIARVRTNLNTFAQKIQSEGLDLRVIVVSARGTSPRQVCIPAPLGLSTMSEPCGDNPPLFTQIDQSISSNDPLSQLLMTYDREALVGLDPDSFPAPAPGARWKDAARYDAWKVFVVITDDESLLPAAEFDQRLLAKAPSGMFGTAAARRYVLHSIISKSAPAGSGEVPCENGNPGTRYEELSALTGGLVESLCNPDYSSVLGRLADGITEQLSCQLSVPEEARAKPDSMVVRFTSSSNGGAPTPLVQVTDASKCASVPDGWYFDDNAHPTRIELCAQPCASIASGTGKVDALVGCPAPAPR